MSEATYRVFRRTPWSRVKGGYVPNSGARKVILRRGVTLGEARAMCASGPANMALAADREYRNLSFHEFEQE